MPKQQKVIKSETLFGSAPQDTTQAQGGSPIPGVKVTQLDVSEPDEFRPLGDIIQGGQNLVTALSNVVRAIPTAQNFLLNFNPLTLPTSIAGGPRIELPTDPIYKTAADNMKEWAEKTITTKDGASDLGDIENIIDVIDPRRVASVFSQNAPTVAAAIGATLVNPGAGAALLFGMETGSAVRGLEQVEQEGGIEIDPIFKETVPILVGSVNAALERVGLGKIINVSKMPGFKQKLLGIMTSTLTEGGTEGLQEVNQLLAEVGAGKEIDETDYTRLVESFYAGTVMGMLGGGISSVATGKTESVPMTVEQKVDRVNNINEQLKTNMDEDSRINLLKELDDISESIMPGVETKKQLAGEDVAVLPKNDILNMSQFYRSPENLLDRAGFKDAANHSSRIIEAELGHTHETHKRFVEINDVLNNFSKMSKKNTKIARKQVRKAMEIINQGDKDKIGKLKEQFPEVFDSAIEVNSWFHFMRGRIKDYIRTMYVKHLDSNISDSFNESINRLDVDLNSEMSKAQLKDIKEKFSLKDKDVEILKESVTQFRDIDNWGIDDYIPNIERGQWKLVDKDNNIYAVGVTPSDAKNKVARVLQENPGVKELFVTSEFLGGAAIADQVSASKFIKNHEDINSVIQGKIADLQTVSSVPVKDKFAAPLVKRQNVLKGEDDIFTTMFSYAHAVEKKMALDPVIEDLRSDILNNSDSYPINVKQLLVDQVESAKGSYSAGDRFFDDMLQKFNQTELAKRTGISNITERTRPLIYSRSINTIRKWEGILKMGWRPITSVINAVSGFGHTWTKVGMEYVHKANKFIKTDEGKRFLDNNEHLLGMEFVADITGKLHTSLPWWHPLKLHGAPEPAIRRNGLAANYLYAKDKLGMEDKSAVQYAGRALRFQNFSYNISALPKLMRSPTGRLVTQFKTYMVKELEFISGLRGKEIMRYMGMQMALAGPRGIIYMMRSLPFLFAVGALDQAEEWMEKNMKAEVFGQEVDITRGLPGLAGGDITLPATVQLPNRPEDWAGPFLADMLRLFGNVLTPALNGEDYVFPSRWQEWMSAFPFVGNAVDKARKVGGTSPFKFVDWAKGLAPASYYWDQLVQSSIDPEGWILDRQGNRFYKVGGWWDKMLLASGTKPIEASKVKVANDILKRELIRSKNNKRAVVQDIFRHINAGLDIPDDAIEKAGVMGIGGDVIGNKIKVSKMTAEQRNVLKADIMKKARALEIFELVE